MLSDILQVILKIFLFFRTFSPIIALSLVKNDIMFYYINMQHNCNNGSVIVNKAEKLKYYIESLCIYNFKDDELMNLLYNLLSSIGSSKVVKAQSSFFRIVSKHKSLKSYISKCILTDDNIFTKSACEGSTDNLSESVLRGVKLDLMKLEEISSVTAENIIDAVDDSNLKAVLKTIPSWQIGDAQLPLKTDWDKQLDDLISYHKANGYGKFAKNIAFTWRNNELCPVTSIDAITLADLKNYEVQRQQVIDNTESFLSGNPANNVLLYGDRGTGKSSTVHAILNEYHNQGLRMIEIPKSTVSQLGIIREEIASSPMKFIIYIDDLSFDSNDTSFSELKAALEGSLSGKQPNTLIYATSNRRHLIKESYSDRQNEMNINDIMQEQLSLSDRFGLIITFMNPDKKNYLEIVEKICDDRNITVDKEYLLLQAEKWAIRRGGRSPRCAKQFVDFVESCENRGKEW